MKLDSNSRILIIGNCPTSKELNCLLKSKNLIVSYSSNINEIENQFFDLAFIFTEDNLDVKLTYLSTLESMNNNDGLVCVNLDAINLETVQKEFNIEVLGVNFNFPFLDSKFMEIINTPKNRFQYVDQLKLFGSKLLNKDPYVVNDGISARAYMLAAMCREAFFLVENGYANIESIDRACRNDAGFYMPFTGNFLYMDLMGTIAYALVMKDLNPELSNSIEIPSWVLKKIEEGKIGMKRGFGFYNYEKGDYEKWNKTIQEFSVEINKLINKYDQNYVKIQKP